LTGCRFDVIFVVFANRWRHRNPRTTGGVSPDAAQLAHAAEN
jgi:hypothetical protein